MVTAIIVAAGQGTRMGANVDKLFLEVAGKPVIAHTWARFNHSDCVDEIVMVIREEKRPAFAAIAAECGLQKPYRLVIGGQERQDSVWNGLESVSPATEMVLIQDGARPCTSEALIAATISAAREVGAAVAAQRVTDTIKESDGGSMIARTVDRSRLWSVQTPQTFRLDVIRRALSAVRARGLVITDDTAACELIGQPVKLVDTAGQNPKVTTPADLPIIDLILRQTPR